MVIRFKCMQSIGECDLHKMKIWTKFNFSAIFIFRFK